MKNILIFCLVLALVLPTFAFADGPKNLELSGEALLLVDQDSGRILYEKNSDKKIYPASTTKIMTAILAIEYGKMDDMVLIDDEIVDLTDGSHIALDRQEEVKFEDLLNALLIASANDAAMALGKHIAGSLDAFADMMNAKAKELGAVNTHFANAHGLHDENHYTTAYDLYLMASYAMENDLFREIVNKTHYTIEPTNVKEEARLMHTTNKFLYGNGKLYLDDKLIPIRYEGISGVKTGYTPEAGNCLVSFAQKGGRNVYSVVLKSKGTEVYSDTMELMDLAFEDFTTVTIASKNEFIDNVDVANGKLPYASAILDKDIYYSLAKDETSSIERKVVLDEDLVAPISKGDPLGMVEFYLNGEKIAETQMVSTLAVDLQPATKLKDQILDKWYLVLFGLWFIFRILVLFSRRRRRKSRSPYYQ